MPRSSARAAIRKMFRRAVIKPPRSKRSHSRDLPFFVDLQPLELSTDTFPAGTPQGSLFAIISNATPGSTVVADDPRVQVDSSGTKLQVGQSPASPGSFDVTLTETQGDLTNDTVITITVSGALADTTAPTILNSNAATVAENATLAFALTANETVTWTLVGGADQARFEISGSTLRWLSNGTKNFEAPNDANTDNAYIVTVRATDTAGNATDQTITVTVSDIDELAPTITSATTGNNVENTALAFALTADETVTWSLTGGTDLARFELNGSTLRWAGNGTKNFEAPNDSNTNNTYVVQVTATDTAGNATNQTVTITVTDADEVAPTITSSATPSVVENQTFSLTLTANETVTWSKIGGDDATQFTLVGSTLSMTPKDFETMGDFNTDNVYEVTVRATDTAGNTTDQNITVTVTDADEIAPTITSSASPTVAESSVFSMSLTANETVTWTKTGGADAALFTLVGSTLSLTAKDYEVPVDADGNNTYVVQVRATDTAGNFTDQTITLTVTDVDDTAPTITSSATQTVAENSPFSMTLTANETVTWSKVGGSDQALFGLTGSTLSLTARDFESPTDSNTNNTYVVTVRATDTNGNTSDQTITLTVTDVDDTAPTITSSASPSVAENVAFSMGLTANETVTWTKTGGSDTALFTLVGSTLSMTAKDFEAPVDSNANNTYVVQVTATDTAGNATNQTITVTVTDAVDTYTFTNTEASTYVAAMSVQPDITRKAAIDTLIGSLKSAGIWTGIEVLSLFAAHDSQAALLNAKDTTKVWTPVNSPTFTVDRGYTGDAVSKQLTYPTAYAFLTSFIQNSASWSIGIRSVTLGSVAWVLGAAGTGSTVGLLLNTTLATPRVNNSAAGNVGAPPGAARYHATRNVSTALDYFVNNGSATNLVVSSATRSTNLPCTHRNNTSFSNAQVSYVMFGKGFTSTEIGNFDSAIAAYLTAVGA